MSRSFVILLGLVVLFVGAIPANADDLNPPIWRGLPGSTVQEWDFLTAGVEVTPEFHYTPDGTTVPYVNTYGGALARYTPGTGQEWWDVLDGRDGVLPLSGQINLDIWNLPELNPEKLIRLQITWQEQVDGQVPVISIPEFEPGSEPFDWLIYDEVTTPFPEIEPGNWQHTVIDISIWPNPHFETIRIDGAIDVDQIVVDTICIPEPGSIALLLCGLVSLIGWRRRS